VEVDELPHLQRWLELIRLRPAVLRGLQAPPSTLELRRDSPEEAQKFAEQARKMVEMGQSKPAN
jgi:glutathione S-transferase/GST-like protein